MKKLLGKKMVKTTFATILAVTMMISASGCGNKVPKDWYGEVRDYYTAAFKDDWSHDVKQIIMKEEYKDKSLKFGYYIIDLDIVVAAISMNDIDYAYYLELRDCYFAYIPEMEKIPYYNLLVYHGIQEYD